ncbi:MAG: hypothetical protein V4623_06250 [Pseudomonadota bacterium]
MGLDVIGYNPRSVDLVHDEPSVDPPAWETREARYAERFRAARKLIFSEVLSWLPAETPLRQIAVFSSAPSMPAAFQRQLISDDKTHGDALGID